MRIDVRTGIEYTDRNIPIGKPYKFYEESTDTFLKIMALDESEECWYNYKFIGTYYAVFKYNKNFKGWQQVSNWYSKYKNSINFIYKNYTIEEKDITLANLISIIKTERNLKQ